MPPAQASRHLPLLQAMFPGKVFLGIEDVAQLLQYGVGHLYNLNSKGKLPFKLSRDVGNRFSVSILEMADYLDKSCLSDYEPPRKEVAPVVEPPKKRGRPRGSTTRAKSAELAMGFQSELRAESYRQAQRSLVSGLSTLIGAMRSQSGDCETRLSGALAAVTEEIEVAEASLQQLDERWAGGQQPPPFGDRRFPFFVLPSGLITSLAVNLEPAPFRLVAETKLAWYSWEEALAGVWEHEPDRLAWIERLAPGVEGLSSAIERRRSEQLSRL